MMMTICLIITVHEIKKDVYCIYRKEVVKSHYSGGRLLKMFFFSLLALSLAQELTYSHQLSELLLIQQ